MAKITPTTISSGYLSTTQHNANNTAIAAELNDKVLYRNNPSGEPNDMHNNLDMNGYKILNLPTPTGATDVVRLQDISGDGTVNITGMPDETNIQALRDRSLTSHVTSDVVYVKSHTTLGDGGHGVFRYITTGGPYTDNSGTIIVPTGGDGSAAWLRESTSGDIIDPRHFGVAESSSNNATALAKVIAASQDKLVEWPDGTFITSALTINVKQTWRLRAGTTIQLKDASNTSLITITAAGSVIEGNGVLDANKAGQSSGSGSAVYINSVADVKLRGIEIKNARGSNVLGTAATRTLIRGCTIHDSAGKNIVLQTGSSRSRIIDNEIYNAQLGDGIHITGGSNFCQVRGNDIHGNVDASASTYYCGVRVTNSIGTRIVDNEGYDHTDGAAILVETSALRSVISKNICHNNLDGILVDTGSHGTSVTDNHCYLNTNDGMDLNENLHITCVGNVCELNGDRGILTWGLKYSTIQDNVCINNNTSATANFSGIDVRRHPTTTTESEHLLIEGNICRDNQAVKTQVFGIHVWDASTNITCRNNDVTGNLTGGINDSTAAPVNNIKAHNIGYKTEASGNAGITAGNTTVTVSPSLVSTGVTLRDVVIAPNSNVAGLNWWVDTLTATSFVINISAAHGSDLFFRYHCAVFEAE